MIRGHRERVLSELSGAPAAGITRGELATLMLDVADDAVSEVLDALTQSDQITGTDRDGSGRFQLVGGV